MKNKFPSHPTLEYQKLSQQDINGSDLSDAESDGSSIDLLDETLLSSSSLLRETSLTAEVTNFNITLRNNNDEMKLEIYEELVGSGKSNIKKILLIVGFGMVLIALFAVAFYFLSPVSTVDPTGKDGSKITLEDILYGRLQASRFNATWVDDALVYRDLEGNLMQANITSGQTSTLLDTSNEDLAEGFKFEPSADNRYLLVGKRMQKIFRHSFLALYDIVDLEDNNRIIPITVQNLTVPLNLVHWSPSGNSFIFVHANNIYYKSSPLADEIQLTTDGNRVVYNGIPDWVYEEEVLSSNIATWFSPEGSKIAFIRFDDSNVPIMKIPFYGQPGYPEFQYPQELILHYPKAGARNPVVSLFTVDLKNSQKEVILNEIPVPIELVRPEADHIIATLGWADEDTLVTIWKNRVQNRSIIQSCTNGTCDNAHDIRAKGGWLELFSEPIFNKEGSHFVVITSQEQGGDAGAYRHVTMFSVDTNQSVPLTKGKFVVQEILKWDAETNLVFYSSNVEKDSKVLQIFAVLATQNSVPQCLTCNIKGQTYFSAQFSDVGNYVVLSANGPNVPYVDIFEWKYMNKTISVKLIESWESNNELSTYLKSKISPKVIYHDITLDNGSVSKVTMQLPVDADLSGATKYPMLIEVYGGPNSFMVTDSWTIDWGSYMASNRSIIYAKIDGRGSGLRGDKVLFSIYEKLGTVEIEDQINTAKKLHETLKYIDPARIAIWGWSYGGYASGMSLAKDKEHVFKCAASVAPVTDWTFYDSIYTERYMRLPTREDNKVNYDASRLTDLVENFRNRTYLLIHGTLDDNVHFQQAMALSRLLEINDIDFRQVSYPDENHGLIHVRPHLYHTLGRYFDECFNLKH